jgi:hypothetical protein
MYLDDPPTGIGISDNRTDSLLGAGTQAVQIIESIGGHTV